MIKLISIFLFALSLKAQPIIGFPIRSLAGPCSAVQYTNAFTITTGTAAYLYTNGNLRTAADSKTFTISTWVIVTNNNYFMLFTSGGSPSDERFVMNFTGAPALPDMGISAKNSANSVILSVNTAKHLTANAWNHIFFTCDLSDSTKRHYYVNGVEDLSVTYGTYSNDFIDFNIAISPAFQIGNNGPGALHWSGAIAELWMDLTYHNNPLSFYCGGHPVNLGTNGQTPTGSAPLIYFSLSGSGTTWTNDSSGNLNSLNWTGATPGSTTSP